MPAGTEVNALDEEVIDLMAEAGFSKIFLAVESADEAIQAAHVDKKVKLDRLPPLVARLRGHGITVEGAFMVGFPGETKEQMDRTFDAATTYDFDRIAFSIVNPLPGTRLYDECVAEGLLHDDFDPEDVRYSNENIRMADTERGYIAKRRRQVWRDYMAERIDVERMESRNIRTGVEGEEG